MASNQRTPRDLRQMVNESNQDIEEIQKSLAKLKALKEDDKTEAAMLRSRIDEQSRLIMILKQRADEELLRAQALDKINKELTDLKEHSDDMIKNETRKYNILDSRFSSLASNHEEMIKIKDEYKRVNQELREENARLKSENSRLFSKVIQEKDAKIEELEKKFAIMKEQNSNMESRIRQLQQEWREREEVLKKELHEVTEKSVAQLKDLQQRLQDSEERLKGANHKLQVQQDSTQNLQQELQSRFEALTKERDELLELSMQRGRLIQKEQAENKRLLKKAEDVEKLMKLMQDKFDREAAAVSANLQVRKLKDEIAEAEVKYTDMQKEFTAFKKHSSELLRQEKELNERLRHIVG